jgi:plasmid stabilization system protein ParE
VRRYEVRFTREARDDLKRLYAFLLEQDPELADRAREAIGTAFEMLAFTPYTCRKAMRGNPWLRELVIPFGRRGYVALVEIDDDRTVTIIAVRHQRESDLR